MPDGDYGRFLREYGHVEMTPGDFVDREGRVLGRHKGLPCYTTGQRKGLGVSAGRHVYVVRKNAADNTILLGDNEELYARELTACRVNWISGTAPTEPVAVTAKTRYSQTEAEAEVTPCRRGGCGWSSASPSGPSPPDRPWCSTTGIRCWAAASSKIGEDFPGFPGNIC